MVSESALKILSKKHFGDTVAAFLEWWIDAAKPWKPV